MWEIAITQNGIKPQFISKAQYEFKKTKPMVFRTKLECSGACKFIIATNYIETSNKGEVQE